MKQVVNGIHIVRIISGRVSVSENLELGYSYYLSSLSLIPPSLEKPVTITFEPLYFSYARVYIHTFFLFIHIVFLKNISVTQ